VVVWYGLAILVYARVGTQVLAVSIERDQQAMAAILQWLESKQKDFRNGRLES